MFKYTYNDSLVFIFIRFGKPKDITHFKFNDGQHHNNFPKP